MSDAVAGKFGNVDDELCQSVYDELIRFVRWLASSNHDENNIMMSADEIVGELMLELVKGVAHYKNLEREKLLAVVKRMMDNRISELRYRYYVTHRKAHAGQLSLDQNIDTDKWQDHDLPGEECIIDVESEESVEGLVESSMTVKEVRSRLSINALKVFDTVVGGKNPRLAQFLMLSADRMKAVSSGGKARITKDIVANSVVLPRREVRKAYREIQSVYNEVVNGR